jgi:ABC-type multidrug transport system fused ATPase/permease subunit
MKKEAKTSNVYTMVSRFLDVNKEHRRRLLLCGALQLLTAVALSARGLLIGDTLGSIGLAIGAPGGQPDQLLRSALLLVAAQILLFPFSYFANYVGGDYARRCARTMSEHTFFRIANADIETLEREKIGDLVSRANIDLNQFVSQMTSILTNRLPGFVFMLVAFVVCFFVNWKLSLISFTIIPLLVFLQSRTGIPIAKYSQRARAADGRAVAIANNLLGGHLIAKALLLGDEMQKRFDRAVQEAVTASQKSFVMEFVLLPLQYLMQFLPKIIIMAAGVYLITREELTPGALISFVFLSDLVLEPISYLAWFLRAVYQAAGTSARIFAVWDLKQESRGGGGSWPVAAAKTNGVAYSAAASGNVSRSPAQSCQARRCCCWMKRRPLWIRRAKNRFRMRWKH